MSDFVFFCITPVFPGKRKQITFKRNHQSQYRVDKRQGQEIPDHILYFIKESISGYKQKVGKHFSGNHPSNTGSIAGEKKADKSAIQMDR